MKQTKRRWLASFFSAAIFLLSLTACTPQVAPGIPSSGSEVSNVSSQVPQPEPVPVAPSFGFVFQIPGVMISTKEGTEISVKEFEYAGGEVKGNLILRSESGKAADVGTFLLCDGVPTEYTLLESGETGFFHRFYIEGERVVKIAFTPDFDLGLGRIEFKSIILPEDKDFPGVCTASVFHAVLPQGYQAAGSHSEVIGDAEDTQFIATPEVLQNVSATRTDLFVTNSLGEMVGNGSVAYEIENNSTTRIGVRVPAPGKYRLTFILDGEPLVLPDGKTVLNCEFGEDEMFSTMLPLKSMIPAGEHGLFAIATRVDDQTYQTQDALRNASSSKVKITN